MNKSYWLTASAHWLLRIALGSVFIFHGSDKILNMTAFSQMMEMSESSIILLAFAELVGGMLIVLGGLGLEWASRIGGLAIIPPMLGAITLVHWGQWRFTPSETHPIGGMEFQVVLLLLAVFFVLDGSSVPQEIAQPTEKVEQSAEKIKAFVGD